MANIIQQIQQFHKIIVDMDKVELYKTLGVSYRGYMFNACMKEVMDPRIRIAG